MSLETITGLASVVSMVLGFGMGSWTRGRDAGEFRGQVMAELREIAKLLVGIQARQEELDRARIRQGERIEGLKEKVDALGRDVDRLERHVAGDWSGMTPHGGQVKG